MNLTYTLGIVTVAIAALFFTLRHRPLRSAVMLLCVTLLSFTTILPALAAQAPHLAALAADDSVLDKGKEALEESLKLNPGGEHYTGLEYAKSSGIFQRELNDADIREKIDSEYPDSLVVAVTNGSVRLSGRVEDKETAKSIVEQIKEIPGVHEITFDLGLNSMKDAR